MFCQKCGAQLVENEPACSHCGAMVAVKEMKYCQHCGEHIEKTCVVCPKCGKQVETVRSAAPTPPVQPIVINNTNTNVNRVHYKNEKNKWVAFLLCLFLGMFGAHKFYEGKIILGIVYLLTGGIFGIGYIIDIFRHLFKPNPYYV